MPRQLPTINQNGFQVCSRLRAVDKAISIRSPMRILNCISAILVLCITACNVQIEMLTPTPIISSTIQIPPKYLQEIKATSDHEKTSTHEISIPPDTLNKNLTKQITKKKPTSPPAEIPGITNTNQDTLIILTSTLIVLDVIDTAQIRKEDNNKPPINPVAGFVWNSPIDNMEMVFVPEGEFVMGSNELYEHADPQHSIYLDDYWIDKTEVTNAMFASFLNIRGNQIEGGKNWFDESDGHSKISRINQMWKSTEKHQDHPVVEVTWYGAQAYCQWVGRRLPTEAEWEKSARGENGLTYPWGDTIDCSYTNVINCIGETINVGSYPEGKSVYGALDLTGNVWEWVLDWHSEDYYAIAPYANPKGPFIGTSKVFKGGSYISSDTRSRSFIREWTLPSDSWNNIGFRCAVSP